MGFRYRTPSYADDVWDDYYYEKNMQGDIVRVYNSEGVKLVSYVYTAWGDRASTTYHHGGANTTVTNNPFTYRGYYYDRDLDLYCTSTRYYDSNIGRWISPDSVMSGVGGDISGYNLYAYCFNNPVMYSDHTGCWPSWVEKVAIAVAIVAVVATVAAITVSTAGAGTAAAVIAVSAAKGAAAGMVTGAAIGAASGAISHLATTGSWEGAGEAALNGMADGALSGAITGAVTGALCSGIKVAQAAKSWNNGTFKTGYQSMNHHFKNKAIKQGYGKGNNVIKYTNDALDFANTNSSYFKYNYSKKYGHARWYYGDTTGGGYFSTDGKIFTFWYKG